MLAKKRRLKLRKALSIWPLLNNLKENVSELPQEEHQSVEKQIIAFKGRSSYKQYLTAKLQKKDMKIFKRAGISGHYDVCW